jgi:hypothetical protein
MRFHFFITEHNVVAPAQVGAAGGFTCSAPRGTYLSRWVPTFAGATAFALYRDGFGVMKFCGSTRLNDSVLCAKKYVIGCGMDHDFRNCRIGFTPLLSFVHFIFNFHNCA